MKPQKTIAGRGRWMIAALAAVGLVAVGTAVSSTMVSQPEAVEPVQVAAVERPSYLSELPDLTKQALQSGVIAPPEPSAPVPPRQQVATLSVSAPEPEVAEAAPEESPDARLLRVTTNGLNVRSGPSSDSGKLFVLKQDEAVQVAEMNGSWARVMTASGETGWAYQRYLAPAE